MTVFGLHERMLGKLARVLKRDGGLYELEDLLDEIHDGKMQSFAVGNTWVITQVLDFPRKRVLQVRFLVGSMDDLPELENKVLQFAKEIKADLVRAQGRDGWRKLAKNRGWRTTNSVYMRDV